MKPCQKCGAAEECSKLSTSEQQPYGMEFTTADGVFVKQMVVEKAGTLIPQHSHAYDHTTMLTAGRIKAWGDGELLGEFVAPVPVFIKAGVKHKFQTLEDNTILYCIHNMMGSDKVEVLEEHQIIGDHSCQ